MSVRFAICALIIVVFGIAPALLAQAQTAAPAAAAAAPAAAVDGSVIGTIQEVEGTGTVTPQGGAPVAAAINGPVHMNDVIASGPQSRIFVLLIDNTQFTLSENSKLTVNEWVYDPDNNTNNKGRYSVLDGAFEYVSGLLAKKPNPDVQIDTQVGSIGIRGTDLEGGDVDGQYGVHVDEGAVDVITDKGQVRVNSGQGTTLRGRGFAPEKPKKWSQARLSQMRQRVVLKHPEVVRQRVAAMQSRHAAMRQNYKQFQQTHPGANQRQLQRGGMNQQPRGLQQQGKALQQGRGQQQGLNNEQVKAWRQRQGQGGQGQGQGAGQAAGQAAAAKQGGGGGGFPFGGGKLQQLLQGKGGGAVGDALTPKERQDARRKRLQDAKDKNDQTPATTPAQ